VNNDGTVNLLDLALLNNYYWDPPVSGLAGYYEVKYDIAPVLQYQEGMLPPPGTSVGIIDVLDMALVNLHWGEGLEPPDPPGPTMLVAGVVDDPYLVSDGDPTTPEFSIDVTIEDVEAMWGFQFKLTYDTSVLTATGLTSYYPFTWVFYSNIDDTQGYVSIGCLMPPPEPTGAYILDPYPIASIAFSVDALGASPLNIKNSVVADIHGEATPHTVINGWFRNMPGLPIADFSWTPWSAQAGQTATFTSLSFDPEGSIVAFDWNWGDGTPHGTMETETHAWATDGTYTVTLTVTDNDGLTDSQARSMVILPLPLAGAIATTGRATHKLLDFTKHGTSKQFLQAWAKNIDKTRPTLVTVKLNIWSSNYGYLGTITTQPIWIDPGQQGQFKGQFDMMDPKWMFVGGRVTEDEFTVIVNVYYADYFFNNDPNTPHWAQVPDAPEVAFTFMCKESAPVPVMAYTYDATTGTVLFDGSKCTDRDIKWGDYIAAYRWQIYENGVGLVGQVVGPNPSFTLPEDGEYRFRLRVEDMFGVRVQTPWTAYVYFDVP
jgi:PKD repeat protein